MLFVLSVASGQSVLEDVWNTARTNCKDAVSAQKTLDDLLIQYAYRWSSYKPSLSVSSSLSYTDSWENVKDNPSSMNAGLSYSHNLPGSLSFGTDISYGLARSLFDPLLEPDSQNITYNHTASASVSITQSLLPFWRQGYYKDPFLVEKSLLVCQAQEQKEAVQKKIIQAVTSIWIRMRMLSRSSRVNTLLIDYTNDKLLALEELLFNGQIDREKIWEEESTRQSYVKEKISIDNEYNEQYRQLLLLLCDSNSGKKYAEGLFSDLPSHTVKSGTEEHEKKVLELEKEIILNKKILLNQYDAPFIKIGTGVSCTPEVNEKDMSFEEMWKEKKNWNWNISISIDLSSIFSREKLKEEKLSHIALDDINNNLKSVSEESNAQQEYYNSYITSLRESQQIALKIQKNYEQKTNDYKTLYSNGGCTLLDLQTCELRLLISQIQYENLIDELWYYTWLLQNLE